MDLIGSFLLHATSCTGVMVLLCFGGTGAREGCHLWLAAVAVAEETPSCSHTVGWLVVFPGQGTWARGANIKFIIKVSITACVQRQAPARGQLPHFRKSRHILFLSAVQN